MFDQAAETFLPEILLPTRRRTLSEISAAPEIAAQDRDMGRGESETIETTSRASEFDLAALAEQITESLPWVSRTSEDPVGMWVEEAGFVDVDYEAFPAGTPYVSVGVDSWGAATAVYEALCGIARIEDGAWVVGWAPSERGFKKIKIYPELRAEP
jgi:hypothetical protein